MKTKPLRLFLSLTVSGLALAAAVVPTACTPNCKTGTITMQIYLNAPISDDADRVVVTSTHPAGLDISAQVSRTAGTAGIFLDLAFPHGYVANKIVTIRAQAFAGPVLLGEGQVTIHTLNQCSSGIIYIGPLMPAEGADGGS